MRETFLLDLAAPVPVGNHAELVFFERCQRGWLGEVTGWELLDHEPLVRDITSGIEYASARIVSKSFDNGWFDHRSYTEELDRESIRVAHRVLGTVTACRLATMFAHDTGGVTRLVVDVEESSKDR